jgi:hypothetical protein
MAPPSLGPYPPRAPPLGISLRRCRRPPGRHHRIPNELLHPPYRPITVRATEIPRQQLPHQLRIPRLRQRGESHQIANGTEDTRRSATGPPPGPAAPTGEDTGPASGSAVLADDAAEQCQRMPASRAKTLACQDPARRTTGPQRDAAIAAEPGHPPLGRTTIPARHHGAIVFSSLFCSLTISERGARSRGRRIRQRGLDLAPDRRQPASCQDQGKVKRCQVDG